MTGRKMAPRPNCIPATGTWSKTVKLNYLAVASKVSGANSNKQRKENYEIAFN